MDPCRDRRVPVTSGGNVFRFLRRLSLVSRRVCLSAVAGIALSGGPAAAQTGLVEEVEGDRPFGSVAAVGPLERLVSSQPGVWSPIPGLATGVYSREGDALEITVSGETLGTDNTWVQALVDGAPASPSRVLFRRAGDTRPENRSFTFVHPRVGAGQHVVEVRWLTGAGTTAQMRRRALTVQSASSDLGAGRLAVAAGTSEPAAGVITSWTPVPQMTATLTTETRGNLAATFSADASVDTGRFFARAVVDGVAVSDVLLVQGGVPRAPRSYTFVAPNVPAGTHTVRIDYLGEGGTLYVGPRSLSVFASPKYLTQGGGMAAGGLQLAPTAVSGTSWVDVASELFWSADAASSSIVTVGAEVRVTAGTFGGGRLYLRAVVDGRIAQPGLVEVIRRDSRWRAQSFSFALKNLAPGLHDLKVQAMADAFSTAYVGDRFWRLIHKRRSGSEFAQPFLHTSQTYTQAPIGRRSFAPLVICFDPVRPEHPAPSFAELRDAHDGQDGGVSVRGWFAENSGGRLTMATPTYVGCADGSWSTAPLAHQGDWYWENQAWDTMFKEALLSADAQVDYHALDRNRDGQLTPDEVVIEMVHPQNVPDGFGRSTSVAVDGISAPLTVHFSQLYASASPDRRRENVGIASHEMAHLTLHAEDLYGCASSTAPGAFSMMSARNVTHLDPWHKLHSGFVAPALVEMGSWSTRTVAMGPVETGRQALLLYDLSRGDREYFIVENRVPSTVMHDDPGAGGVVVWHLFDDPALAQEFPPPGGASCSWDRNSVRKERVLRFLGDSDDLVWADGTPAGIRVTMGFFDELGGQQVEIARLP